MKTPEELRNLVAEKVMGCELKIVQDEQGYDEEWWVFPADGDECLSEGRLRGQWLPDVDWRDAGRVIERMRELGFELTLECFSPSGNLAVFSNWAPRASERVFEQAVDDNPKEAISLAALRALGMEVEC